jgi:DNA-binding HxlR family transcriptional regulator
MKNQGKNIVPPGTEQSAYRCLEDVIGCKWSVSVLLAAGDGVTRPGAMEKSIPDISTKVLNERLRKLTHYGLLQQTRHPESPPRTEYTLTDFGRKVVALIAQIRELDTDTRAD